ncbi:NAD(P)H-dependent oxidoreductase [Schaalia sp. 19OD2882]|uniref:NAD(P)H-dependent oxidoreductase n=1 Tax=Schaalia sp. 19OD2882 TaxID=2794089 RepID=UPI001C1EA278|nr:NAD(P)H-dependent oxidoreductase [Schaalia sp. 19OD2882]QWW20042.1 NAD(P)H-dependent oxidoreductase [Schaalia sp. 19OD2882]
MKTVINIFHPDMSTSRVNARLAREVQDIEGIVIRDIYGLYPDWKIDVPAEQAAIEAADRVVWQFPLHWYSGPALMKEWQDVVLSYGWAYGSTGMGLVGKELLIACTVGSPAQSYAMDGAYRTTLHELFAQYRAITPLVGMKWLDPFTVTGTLVIADAALDWAARQYRERLLS